MTKKAVILFSGGLDSTTCLAIAKSQGFECYALSFDYGQRNHAELNAAKKIAKNFAVKEHKIFRLPLDELKGSALTDRNISVPNYKGDGKIPVTYVPARNTIFLSIALGWAEVLNAQDIFYGANALDYSGYTDCRPAYVQAFQQMANLATKAGVEGNECRIHAPLIHMTKAQIIETGLQLGIDYSQTISCYRAREEDGAACGTCDSCTLRKKGFAAIGGKDSTLYVG